MIKLTNEILNVLYPVYLEYYSNTFLKEKILRPTDANYPAKKDETNKRLLLEATVAIAVTDAVLTKASLRSQIKGKSQFLKKLQSIVNSDFAAPAGGKEKEGSDSQSLDKDKEQNCHH